MHFQIPFCTMCDPQRFVEDNVFFISRKFPLVKEDWVKEHLGQLDIHKFMGSDRMYPQVLRELADTITIIFERPWSSEAVPGDWK